MQDTRNKNFIAIASSMPEFAEDSVELYWMTKRFFKLTETFKDSIPLMVCVTEKYYDLMHFRLDLELCVFLFDLLPIMKLIITYDRNPE